MQVLESEIRWYGNKNPLRKFKDLTIVVISDLHFGNPFCSIRHFNRTLDFIKRKDNCFCFLNGDLLEAVVKTSKGDVYNQVMSPKEQRKAVTNLLMPIKDKILGMTTGNHEQRLTELTSEDPSELIADSLEIPYRPEGMLFKISFGGNNCGHSDKPYVFWAYITHGYGGARTKSSKAVKIERTASWIHADWYAMSHDHVVNVAPNVYLMPDNRSTLNEDGFLTGKVTAKREMLIKTNAYLKWGGYAESGGFPPSDLATPIISLLTPDSPQWDMYPERPRQAVKVSV